MGLDCFLCGVLDRHAPRLVQQRNHGGPPPTPTGRHRGGHPNSIDNLLDRVFAVRERPYGQLRLECLLSACHTRIDRRLGDYMFDFGACRVAGMGLFGATDSFRGRSGTLVCASVCSIVVMITPNNTHRKNIEKGEGIALLIEFRKMKGSVVLGEAVLFVVLQYKMM